VFADKRKGPVGLETFRTLVNFRDACSGLPKLFEFALDFKTDCGLDCDCCWPIK